MSLKRMAPRKEKRDLGRFPLKTRRRNPGAMYRGLVKQAELRGIRAENRLEMYRKLGVPYSCAYKAEVGALIMQGKSAETANKIARDNLIALG
ncbi:MAG: hypothetical protein WC602_03650 [archaeon]